LKFERLLTVRRSVLTWSSRCRIQRTNQRERLVRRISTIFIPHSSSLLSGERRSLWARASGIAGRGALLPRPCAPDAPRGPATAPSQITFYPGNGKAIVQMADPPGAQFTVYLALACNAPVRRLWRQVGEEENRDDQSPGSFMRHSRS